MPQCFVTTCGNYYGKTRQRGDNDKIIYHQLPPGIALAARWARLCGYKGFGPKERPPQHARVCSEHFSESCYQRDLQHELLGLPLRRKLKPDAVPDQNLPVSPKRPQKEKENSKDNKNLPPQKSAILTEDNVKSPKKQNKKENGTKSNKTQTPTPVGVSIDDNLNKDVIEIHDDDVQNKTEKKMTKLKTKQRVLKNNTSHKNSAESFIDLTKDPPEPISVFNTNEVSVIRLNGNKNEMDKSDKKPQPVKSKTFQKQSNLNNFIKKASSTENLSKSLPEIKTNQSIPLAKNQEAKASEMKPPASVSLIEKRQMPSLKNLDKPQKLPMRSSIRIAKKKSIECLSDSFTEKVNSKKASNKSEPEKFSDKLKFMAKLQLRFERRDVRNQSPVKAPVNSDKDDSSKKLSLNKMQIVQDNHVDCHVESSSPPVSSNEEMQVKAESARENGCEDGDPTSDINGQSHEMKEECEVEENEVKEVKEEEGNSNGSSDSTSSGPSGKRKAESSDDTPLKRLRVEIQENFISRDKILSDFVEYADCNTYDQIQTFSEQLLSEIRTLNDLAKEKEREWNKILHLKKIKEELLIRMQRKKQIMMINETEVVEENNGQQSLLKSNQKSLLRVSNYEKNKNQNTTQKHFPDGTAAELNAALDFRQKQKPLVDVQSIIADYRQRHPEAVPRRGRRIRHASEMAKNNNVLNLSSTALGSGGQIKQGLESNDFGIFLQSFNGTSESTKRQNDSSQPTQPDSRSFKDMLVQFARLSQAERNELLMGVTRPSAQQQHQQSQHQQNQQEVTVHPVSLTTSPDNSAAATGSLLHGILTKTPPAKQQNNGTSARTSFSPTLARLLTAPERGGVATHVTSTPNVTTTVALGANNVSISEILGGSKSRNEITITPVDSQFDLTPIKPGTSMEDESEECTDRLIIDEGSDRKEESDGADDVPQCQGCHQRAAQFVCAGCGNQWYCSRDCQVAAWDEHSEVCSG